MVDLQTEHTVYPVVPYTVSAWGLREEKDEWTSASCQRSLSPYLAQTSVDCPEPGEDHWGVSLEIKADKSAPTCLKKHVTNIQQCDIRLPPQVERYNAEVMNIKAAVLFFMLHLQSFIQLSSEQQVYKVPRVLEKINCSKWNYTTIGTWQKCRGIK